MSLLSKPLGGALLAAALLCISLPAPAQDGGLLALAARPGQTVIARVWHGRTPRAKADEYERYLSAALVKFPTIKGNLGYQMMRVDGGPDGDDLTEFQVVSYWESLDAIKAYAGADIRRTHDLPRDKEFLVNMEPLVRNYELKVNDIKP
ncbi:MAG: antibiotic biosynthesis monooxygenase family protein [Holophaga sp.]|jgi:heme-degrading monooxygenase HmoA